MCWKTKMRFWLRRRLAADHLRWLHPETGIGHLLCLLRDNEVERVLDVGATGGQFASQLRGVGFEGHFVSIEPSPTTFEVLRRWAAMDPLWSVLRVAGR